jgi:hypothetical protein
MTEQRRDASRTSQKETTKCQTHTAEVPFALGDMMLSSPITHGAGNLGAMIVIKY